MSDALERFRRDYAPLLLRHLSQHDEAGRQAAHDLGRGAVHDGLGLLAVVRVHHELVLDVLATARDTAEALDISRSSADLLLDLVASYDMSQRGFQEIARSSVAPPARD